jgi:transcriptional regulator with XRE-family HTH domain
MIRNYPLISESLKNHQEHISDYRTDTRLNMVTAHKMIRQFFTEKKMSKEELAQLLGVTLEEFEKLNSEWGYKQAPRCASYKLLCLYCKTEWNSYKITRKNFRAKQKRLRNRIKILV